MIEKRRKKTMWLWCLLTEMMEDGSDDRSNIPQVPAAIGVAAATRDGTGMSTFSSRGEANVRDMARYWALGVDIWSAAARATMIGGADGAGDLVGGELITTIFP